MGVKRLKENDDSATAPATMGVGVKIFAWGEWFFQFQMLLEFRLLTNWPSTGYIYINPLMTTWQSYAVAVD